MAARQAGSGIAWLYPLVDGAPPMGWEAATPYLVLPVLLVLTQARGAGGAGGVKDQGRPGCFVSVTLPPSLPPALPSLYLPQYFPNATPLQPSSEPNLRTTPTSSRASSVNPLPPSPPPKLSP